MPPCGPGSATARRRSSLSITQLQLELQALGYYDGPIDGRYSAATIAAVRAFQARSACPRPGSSTRPRCGRSTRSASRTRCSAATAGRTPPAATPPPPPPRPPRHRHRRRPPHPPTPVTDPPPPPPPPPPTDRPDDDHGAADHDPPPPDRCRRCTRRSPRIRTSRRSSACCARPASPATSSCRRRHSRSSPRRTTRSTGWNRRSGRRGRRIRPRCAPCWRTTASIRGVLAAGRLPTGPLRSIHGAELDVESPAVTRHRQHRPRSAPRRGGQRHRLSDRRRPRPAELTQSNPVRRPISTASVRVVAPSLRYSDLRLDFTVFTDRNRRSPISA